MLKPLRALLTVLTLVCAASFLSTPPARAQVSLTTLGTPYTQSFDTLPASGSTTWTNNSTIPGWFHARTGTGTTIVANDGSSNAGNLYSYGTGTATDRALGSLGSGNAAIGNLFWGVRLQNNTGGTITSLDVSYVGEQWRNSAAAAQTVAFSYLVGSPTVTGSLAEFQAAGVAVTSLDFTSPITGGTAGALNGNLAANRVTKTFSITGLSIPNGTEVMLRWSDPDHTGADHGLSIDDFSVNPQGSIVNAPVVPSCPASLATVFGTAASVGVSASDTDGTVTSAAITGITPSDPGTITLTGFTPAGGVGGTANATLDVSNTTPVGSYNVTIQWANNDVTPQTATCGVAVSVTSITKIHDVQGNGAATPIPGATVTVEGVVTANFQGSGKLSGFFLQEEDADNDADPATSEGIFIFCSSCPTAVAEGQRVRATGVVSEFNNMTEITASTAGSVVITNAGNNLAQVTPASIDLPIAGVVNDFYEAREGMKVTFIDTLTVSEYFQLGRFGQIVLYEGGRPQQFTETNAPSVAGNAAWADTLSRRQVILDDDNNRQNAYLPAFGGPADGSQLIFHPQANGGFSVGTQGTDFFRGGDVVNSLTGVLHWSFPGVAPDTWRIRPTASNPAVFTVANPRPATPPAVGGTIRAVGMNLLNYFTTIDTTSSTSSGPCGPSGTLDCRGADSAAELIRQRERASIVICTLNADVYGFAELENTTPSDSINDLLGAVNARCGGAHPYAFANTGGTLGTDAIRVQQIYRTGILSPVGAPLSDLDPIHSRPPTAQTYDVVDAANPAFGQRFTVVINHLKSKGSSAGLPGDTDIDDGAGASNETRTAQANRLLTWINSTVLPAAGDPDVLLLGDFNSYAKEDPINALIAGGYTDLEVLFQGAANAYSYLFDGQLGHLDYGFASASLLPQVTGADSWHINADEVDLFDYNDEVFDSPGEANFEEKPDGSALVPPRVVFQPASPYRASDHDPILVGLFAAADVAITKTDGVTTAVPGGSVTYTITASNAGPDPVTGGTVADTFPAVLTCTWTCVGAGGGTCTASGSGNINDTVNLPVGGSVTYTASCAISASATGTLSNTATVSGGAAGDSTPGNNSATDTDTLTPQADLSITKTDGVTTATPGGSVTYTITASNAGPSNAPGATVADTFPADLTCTWTCVGAGGGTCTASGSGNISDTVNLPAGGSVTYTASCTVSASATGTLSNTATVAAPAGVTDPVPGNDSATDSDTVDDVGDYSTAPPCRAVDTRTGAPLQDGVPQTFTLRGVCGIPAKATVVVLNVTAVNPTGDGELTVYPSDAPPPAVATMPFAASRTRAMIMIVPLSGGVPPGVVTGVVTDDVAVSAAVAGGGTVHVLLDVLGYFE